MNQIIMPVFCFFLPCIRWLSFCRFLHCKSLTNLALMFSFVNQIHQVPSALLYMSHSKIYCLYCFSHVESAIWQHLFWGLSTWLILSVSRIIVFLYFAVLLVPEEWVCLFYFNTVYVLGPLFSSSVLLSGLLPLILSWCIPMTYSHMQCFESAFTKFHPRGVCWLYFQFVKIILDHKDSECLHVLLPSFTCAFSSDLLHWRII